MDNTKIKYIEQASWFKTLDHYPKTIGQLKLLISIFDKMGICNNLNIFSISTMESKRLNILYAILRISNKEFNKYLDQVVKNIFRDKFKIIFGNKKDSQYYEPLLDQLSQDTDHFVCSFMKTNYPHITEQHFKSKFIEHLRLTFKKNFYRNTTKKLSHDINEHFYEIYNNVFNQMCNEFINCTTENIEKMYKTMKLFLDKIFDIECSYQTINNIILLLDKNNDLTNLFREHCMEIDIYSEQKIDDEQSVNQLELFQPKTRKQINLFNHENNFV